MCKVKVMVKGESNRIVEVTSALCSFNLSGLKLIVKQDIQQPTYDTNPNEGYDADEEIDEDSDIDSDATK